jgi:hypothetical protein
MAEARRSGPRLGHPCVYPPMRAMRALMENPLRQIAPAKTFNLNTKEGVINYIEHMANRMVATARAKNADYTGADPSPFANFASVERDLITDTETGFLVRMRDKWSRIISLVGSGKAQVKDESVIDTLVDLANYCLLLAAYLESKKQGGAQ